MKVLSFSVNVLSLPLQEYSLFASMDQRKKARGLGEEGQNHRVGKRDAWNGRSEGSKHCGQCLGHSVVGLKGLEYEIMRGHLLVDGPDQSSEGIGGTVETRGVVLAR